MPEVSVIIPTYNRKEWLREAIESVINQTYDDFEIIVADDGSTDGTSMMISQAFGAQVRLLSLPHTGLPATGRNAGIEAAQGKYIAFLDSDDLWLPQKLAIQTQALEKHSEFGWSYGKAERFGGTVRKGTPEIGWWQVHSGHVLNTLLINNFIPSCTVIVRKSCLDTVGFFDTAPALRSVEDYELWMRLADRYRLHAVNKTIARYRVTGENISDNRVDCFGAERLALELAGKKLGIPQCLKQQALAALHMRFFRYTVQTDPQTALSHLQYSWQLNPLRLRTIIYRLLTTLGGMRLVTKWIQMEKWIKWRLG